MLKRHLETHLKTAAASYPVVTLTGPRQSGKTTLVRAVFDSYQYVSLENPENRAFAVEDPKGFLNQFSIGAVLDEVQRTPELFSYIQGIVDQEDKSGRFIMTGSQNFLLMEKISQSLAGRCSILHLLPFSKAELSNAPLIELSKIDQEHAKQSYYAESHLFQMLFTGFYPRIHDKHLPPQNWLANYYQTYIERDVRQLINIGDTETFGRFVRLCAGRCGQLLNMASLAADCGVSTTTVKRWLSILETSFIIRLLRPHHKNFNKRLVKSPKLYFLDTGLLCYLLGIRQIEQIKHHSARGVVFESWVFSEILKNIYNTGSGPDVYFWRDSSGHEIDFVLDYGSHLIPIEAKSGETFNSDFTENLKYYRQLAGQQDVHAFLAYGGDRSYLRDGISVVSWKNWF